MLVYDLTSTLVKKIAKGLRKILQQVFFANVHNEQFFIDKSTVQGQIAHVYATNSFFSLYMGRLVW